MVLTGSLKGKSILDVNQKFYIFSLKSHFSITKLSPLQQSLENVFTVCVCVCVYTFVFQLAFIVKLKK